MPKVYVVSLVMSVISHQPSLPNAAQTQSGFEILCKTHNTLFLWSQKESFDFCLPLYLFDSVIQVLPHTGDSRWVLNLKTNSREPFPRFFRSSGCKLYNNDLLHWRAVVHVILQHSSKHTEMRLVLRDYSCNESPKTCNIIVSMHSCHGLLQIFPRQMKTCPKSLKMVLVEKTSLVLTCLVTLFLS